MQGGRGKVEHLSLTHISQSNSNTDLNLQDSVKERDREGGWVVVVVVVVSVGSEAVKRLKDSRKSMKAKTCSNRLI